MYSMCGVMYIININILYTKYWKRNHVKIVMLSEKTRRKQNDSEGVIVIVTYVMCNAYLCVLSYIRPDVIVSFHTGFDIHQTFCPVKKKEEKRFSTIKKKLHIIHCRVRDKGGIKDRRHEKRNVKA